VLSIDAEATPDGNPHPIPAAVSYFRKANDCYRQQESKPLVQTIPSAGSQQEPLTLQFQIS
jgi:hypothetical protein